MLKNIELQKIKPNPKNPRHDLGDLHELAKSISTQGIMQSLTVVPCDILTYEANPETYGGDYVIIIGHRRKEAAKIAALTTVPCNVVILSERDQIAAMLTENLQRTDLTLAEQGQGFQMMLDLGVDMKKISSQTGISESTIRRKVKIVKEIGLEQLKKVRSREVLLTDYERLLKVTCPVRRGEVLEKIGTRDFDWCLEAAIKAQEKALDRQRFIAALSTFSLPAEKENLQPHARALWAFHSFDELDFKKIDDLHKGTPQETKFFHKFKDGSDALLLFAVDPPGEACSPEPDPTADTADLGVQPDGGIEVRSSLVGRPAVEQAEAYKAMLAREDARARRDKLLAKFAQAREMRMSFAKQFRPTEKTRDHLDLMTLFAMLQVTRPGPAMLRELFGELGWDRETFEVRDIASSMLNKTYGKGGGSLRFLAAYGCLEFESVDAATSIDNTCAYVKNHRLLRLYDHLGACGYIMSEEEEQLVGGTHPLYSGAKT